MNITPPTRPDGGSGSGAHDAVPPEVAAARPDQKCGKYVRIRKLGSGGMGEVWKCWDTELCRWVALKFLRGDDEAEIARFKREAQLAGKLSHPNIAAIYEVGDFQGKPFIAMQYVDGRTLRDLHERDTRLLARLVRDAARAVDYAHGQGIVHRDIKPENLMMSERQKTPGGNRATEQHVFVMDFGLARGMAPGSDLSQTGAVVGTPSYMSPEQACGDHSDARTDVYGLGATLYMLLAGVPPFQGSSVPEVLSRIRDMEPLPVRKLNDSVPQDLETIVLKSLEKERGRRYGTAGELAEDLTRWLNGEAIEARRASAVYLLRKFVGRRKAVVGVALAGVVGVAVVAAITVPKLLAARTEVRETSRKYEEVSLYLPFEGELDLLRMKFYQPDFRLTDDEFARHDELRSRVRQRMAESRESAQGWYLIGRSCEAVGDYERAAEGYDRALAIDPAHGRTLVSAGRLAIERALHMRFSSPDETARRDSVDRAAAGVALVRRGFESAGRTGAMELDLAQAYLQVIEGRGAPASQALMERWKGQPFVEEFAIVEAISGDISPGEPLLTEVIRRVPSSFRAYLWRGVARATMDPVAALRDLTMAITINPRCAEAWHNRGGERYRHDDNAGALADFTRVIELSPRHSEAYSNRAGAKLMLGDLDGALADLNRAIELRPRYFVALTNRGSVRHSQGDYAGAIADYTNAIAISADHAEAYFNRGNTKRVTGDLTGALEDYAEAIVRDPRHARAYTNRGVVHLSRGDVERALEDYERAIELDPRSPEAHYCRGTVRMRKGDLKGAIADYDRALELNPRYVKAYLNRGAARYQQRDLDAAMADFSRAAELDPRHADAVYNRAVVRQEKGDRDGAAADYRRALEIAPREWASREKAQVQLRELEK